MFLTTPKPRNRLTAAPSNAAAAERLAMLARTDGVNETAIDLHKRAAACFAARDNDLLERARKAVLAYGRVRFADTTGADIARLEEAGAQTP